MTILKVHNIFDISYKYLISRILNEEPSDLICENINWCHTRDTQRQIPETVTIIGDENNSLFNNELSKLSYNDPNYIDVTINLTCTWFT